VSEWVAEVAAFRRRIRPRAVSPVERLLLRAGARFDRLMLRVWMRGDAASPDVDHALRDEMLRAHAFYRDPGFLTDPASFFREPPAPESVAERTLTRLSDGGRCLDLAFASDFTPVYPEARADSTPFGENRMAHARWWHHARCGTPAVVCLHGYASGDPRIDRLAFGVRALYESGLDVLLFTLPFHGRRKPRGVQKSGEGFFARNLARTNEVFAQTVFEVRALMRYLAQIGGGPIGAFGMSLGAYVAALLAAVDPQLAFAIAMIPVTSLTDLIWGEPIHRFRRQEVEAHGISLGFLRELWQVHAPLLRPPLVPRERRFVVGALGDRICPPAHAHALWHHWERPEIHWYPGGHLAQFRRGQALREVRNFLKALGFTH